MDTLLPLHSSTATSVSSRRAESTFLPPHLELNCVYCDYAVRDTYCSWMMDQVHSTSVTPKKKLGVGFILNTFHSEMTSFTKNTKNSKNLCFIYNLRNWFFTVMVALTYLFLVFIHLFSVVTHFSTVTCQRGTQQPLRHCCSVWTLWRNVCQFHHLPLSD